MDPRAPLTSRLAPNKGMRALQRLRRWLVLGYVLIVLVIIAAFIGLTYRDYKETLNSAQRDALSLARSLNEHMTRSFVSVEQAMQNIAEDVSQSGGVSHVSEEHVHLQLQERVRLTPQIRGLIAIDEHGKLAAHGLEYPTRHIDLSDRQYFTLHRDSPSTIPVIGTPVISRTDNKWLIPITRRISDKNAKFGGIILAGVEPDYFVNFYQSLNLDSETHIQFILRSGTVVLAYPMDNSTMGKTARELEAHTFDKLLTLPGSFQRASDTTEGDRFIAQLWDNERYPIMVRVSVRADRVLERFNRDLIVRATIGITTLVLFSALQIILLGQLKRVEQAESRLRLTQHTIDESPDILLWCSQQGEINFANQCMLRRSGYSDADLPDLNVRELIVDPQTPWDTLLSQASQFSHAISEAQLRMRNGNSFPIEVSLSELQFRERIYLCVTARDISERRAVQQELTQHRDHLQELVEVKTAEIVAILNASPLAISLSIDGKLHMINRAFAALFGYPEGDLDGIAEQSIFCGEEHFGEVRVAIAAEVAKDRTFRHELQLQRQDGSHYWAVFFARALDYQHPEKGLIYIIEDITAQRTAAESLRKSEQLNRSVLDTTADAYAMVDRHRAFVSVNQAFCLQMGFASQADVIGRSPEALWGEREADRVFPLLPEPVTQHRLVEVALPDLHGKVSPFLASRGVISNASGQVDYAFVFLTNIASIKQIERSLIEAKEAAERANQAKSLFLTNMSHELRTPMHAILSFSDMGQSKAADSDAATLARYFERILTAGKRLHRLLNDLLDMSSLEAHQMEYDMAPHDIAHIIHDIAQPLSPQIAARRINLRMDNVTPGMVIQCDHRRMSQVLSSLLDNAIRFSPEGDNIDIRLETKPALGDQPSAVRISIRDRGTGIPADQLAHVFETFNQQQATPMGGTGLGLAISKHVVEDHQGRIWAQNHPEGGAMIVLELPLLARSERVRPEPPPASPGTRHRPPLHLSR